ncbi:MAG: complex I subunit 1/NuoH family protein, partial [Acidimicrobiia bacterium]
MRWAEVGIVGLRVVMVFALLLVATLINVWAERKIIADMQSRIGPKRAGPWGILQTVADGLKLFFKESITPRKAELATYVLAPFLAVIPAFLIFMTVPFGAPFTIGGEEVILQGADLNIGLLFILAMSSMAVYAVVLAGWSSGSKYPLIGGIRATAQAISYEAAMGLAMVAVVMFTATQGDGGTLSLAEIVARQEGTWFGIFPRWNLVPQFVAFAIFMIAIVAETNRAPFDLVEAEQEIVGGYHTEYSGMR